MPSPFVHLHTHSHYSLLEALPKIKNLIAHIKTLNMDAVALTDNGTMYGMIEFYQKALEAGVKPILGVDFYLAREGRQQKRAYIDTKPSRLVCLAESLEGYHNLIQLSSIGFLEGFYYKPRIDFEVLAEHTKGLITLSGGHQGLIDEALRMDHEDEARALIERYVKLFGEGNFFLELVDRPEIAEQQAVNAQLIRLSREMGIPLVATKNSFYLKPEENEAWKILNCIKGGKTLEHLERVGQFDYDASLISGEEIEKRFSDVPDAIENTRRIADRCKVELELGKWNFARYVIPEGKTFRQVLEEEASTGLEAKEGVLTDEQLQRLNYEIEIIDQKGFCPYFLIVSDFLRWARSQGIVTTTRGSAAGSLVGYAVGISAINPLVYELPFERFLNPERPSAPDIDADFADNRRDEVLEYVRQKYGTEKVAQICTFGSMLARGSVRDVGRALGFPYKMVDEIAKLVPFGSQGFPMTLDRALYEAPELKKKYDRDEQVKQIIDLARRIEGCSRHVSIHAAGTVIAPTALMDFTPLQIDTREGKMITQYEMKSVESAGLVKIDFLGIRNLSILGDAVALVKKTKGVEIDIERVPLDDTKTFELLSHGHTMGVFQLGGDGMTKYLIDLKPERVQDIMAMVALYRPGPIESIPEYIKRKHDPHLVRYLDPRMMDILSKSYGVLVYQDDVMLIAIQLAGYSWLEADKLRKAMGKKIPEEMVKQKEKLIDGLVEHGMSKEKAHELWKLVEPFAAYGFNKSHACSYGMIAYETAYMKANFPAEYMTALMAAESGDLEKIAEAVKECERLGMTVLPPDINESGKHFTYIDDTHIRFGLLVIKNLGEEVVETMVHERKAHGPYQHLVDVMERITHRAFNKKSLEALIKSGALDPCGERKQLLENIDRILLFHKQVQQEKQMHQQNLFASADLPKIKEFPLRSAPAATMQEKLAWEKELLGLYVSAHPFERANTRLQHYLVPFHDIKKKPDGTFVRVGGVIASVKTIITKKGEPMAFVELDQGESLECICFPRVFAQAKTILSPGAMVLISGKVSKREEEEAKILIHQVMHFTEDHLDTIVKLFDDGVWFPLDGKWETATEELVVTPSLSIVLKGKPETAMVQQMRRLLQSSPGSHRVCLLVESGGRMRTIETDYHVKPSDELLQEIGSLVGPENVRVSKL